MELVIHGKKTLAAFNQVENQIKDEVNKCSWTNKECITVLKQN